MKKLISDSKTKLAATYLGIIMAMCIGFSGVIYRTSVNELDRPVAGDRLEFLRDQTGDVIEITRPGPSRRSLFNDFQKQRSQEARTALVGKLILINISALILGAWFSYYLAKRTLAPIHAAIDAQTRFVSDASHELRTPLTALQTTNEVVLRRKTITEEVAREILAENVKEVEKLRRLTDSLLGIAKNDHADLSLSKVKLLGSINSATDSLRVYAETKKITIDNNAKDHTVEANPHSLTQIISILLDNAIKYSPEKSVIKISTARKQSKVLLSITDPGIGIEAKDIPHIFDRFYRADQSRNKAQSSGFGLGLSIAKDLSDRQNSEISVTSKVGKGSTFTLILKSA